MSMGQRPTLIERRATELRLEVARTAMRIFARDGDTTATVESIAAEAGISARTFHRHFPTKEDVVRPLFRESTEIVIDALEQVGEDADPLDALADAALAHAGRQDLTTSDRRFMRLVRRTPELRLRWLDYDDDLCATIDGFLLGRLGIRPRPGLARLPAELVLQAGRHVTEFWLDGGPASEMRPLMRSAVRMTLAGFLADAAIPAVPAGADTADARQLDTRPSPSTAARVSKPRASF